MAENLEAQMISAFIVHTLAGTDPAIEPYRNLIKASFMKSLRFGNDWFKEIDSDSFYKAYGVYIDQLLNLPGTIVKLALLPDELDTCLGWSISNNETLHYIFVKGDIKARKNGIGKKLLPGKVTTITHLTKIGIRLWKLKMPHVIFNPFI